jgi:26S proteasome regulatory subunit N7
MEVESNLEEEIRKIEAKIKEAEETGGAQDIRDALLEKAALYLKHEEIEESIKNYELAFDKSISSSKKMDIVFSLMRI